MTLFIEIVGWIGALLILLAYILVSSGTIQGRSKTYQWMNIVGSAGFVINSGYNGAIPSAVLNVIWLGIGSWTLWRIASQNPNAHP